MAYRQRLFMIDSRTLNSSPRGPPGSSDLGDMPVPNSRRSLRRCDGL